MHRLGSKGGMKEVLSHPWFLNAPIKEILLKQIDPPIKPFILKINLDEEEFAKGDKEFKNKIAML